MVRLPCSQATQGGVGTVVGTEVAVQSPDTQDLIPGLCHGCCTERNI